MFCLYLYLGSMFLVMVYTTIKKKGPLMTVKIGILPSLIFIFAICIWVVEFSLLLSMIFTGLVYLSICYIIDEPVFNFIRRKKDKDS